MYALYWLYFMIQFIEEQQFIEWFTKYCSHQCKTEDEFLCTGYTVELRSGNLFCNWYDTFTSYEQHTSKGFQMMIVYPN